MLLTNNNDFVPGIRRLMQLLRDRRKSLSHNGHNCNATRTQAQNKRKGLTCVLACLLHSSPPTRLVPSLPGCSGVPPPLVPATSKVTGCCGECDSMHDRLECSGGARRLSIASGKHALCEVCVHSTPGGRVGAPAVGLPKLRTRHQVNAPYNNAVVVAAAAASCVKIACKTTQKQTLSITCGNRRCSPHTHTLSM